MITLTKTDLNRLITLASRSGAKSKALIDKPGQKYAALHKLDYEIMTNLADKLEDIVKSGSKRIEVKGV